MSAATEREIDNLTDLLEATDLTEIQFYEVAGRRFDGFDPSVAEAAESAIADKDVVQVRLLQRHLGRTIAVRCRMELRTVEGTLTADAAAFFVAKQTFQISDQLLKVFAERQVNPLLRPYLREALQSTAARLGMEPLLLEPLADTEDD